LREASVTFVSPQYFGVLGVRVGAGRLLGEDDARERASVAVVSESFGRRAFGARGAVVGRSLVVQGRRILVVGVVGGGFVGVERTPSDVWIPVTTSEVVLGRPGLATERDNAFLSVVGALRREESLERFQAELRTALGRLEAAHPSRFWRRRLVTAGLSASEAGPDDREGIAATIALAMVAGSLFVLLGLSIAAILLASVAGRRRELDVRLALGAPAYRVAGQLVMEALLLSGTGGALGLLVAVWSSAALRYAGLGESLGEAVGVRPFVIGVACIGLCAVLASTLPLTFLRRVGGLEALRVGAGATAGRSPAATSVAVASGSLSFVLLVCAFLFAQSFLRAVNVNLGFVAEGLAVARIDARPVESVADEPSATGGRAGGGLSAAVLLDRVRGVPGVVAAAVGAAEPFRTISAGEIRIRDVDGGQRSMVAQYDMIGPGYLQVLGTPVIAGRAFRMDEFEDMPRVVVVNRALSLRLWGGASAIGRCFYESTREGAPCLEVVGVTEDARLMSPREPAEPTYFLPLGPRSTPSELSVLVRTRGDARAVLADVGRALSTLLPASASVGMTSLREVLAARSRTLMQATVVFMAGAAGATLVSALSLYALLVYRVTQRRTELAIRSALGASPRRLVALVLREGVVVLACSLVVGGALAVVATKQVGHALYDVDESGLAVRLWVGGLLTLVAVGAAWIPARRVAQLEPLAVLRDQ
jgi:predicted permease